jgi:hypothetical protein
MDGIEESWELPEQNELPEAGTDTGEVGGEPAEKPVVAVVDGLNKALLRNWSAEQKADREWNVRQRERSLAACDHLVADLMEAWVPCQEQITADIAALRQYLDGEEYGRLVDGALRKEGIPLQGSFPQYEFPPFKLLVSVEQGEARLTMGRKLEKTAVLEPQALSKWVVKKYQAVVGRKFDSSRLMNDLLEAYKIANQMIYRQEKVLWGRAVGLEMIYTLLTLRRSARQEYPKPLYLFELGKLKELVTLQVGEYRFELGFARDQFKALLIVDSRGRDSHLSSLTIYHGPQEITTEEAAGEC